MVTLNIKKMFNLQKFSFCDNHYYFALIKNKWGISWQQLNEQQQCLDVFNYFREIHIPFCSLCIAIILVKNTSHIFQYSLQVTSATKLFFVIK